MTPDPTQMAEALAATGDYRVLRRIEPRQVITEPDDTLTLTAVVLDVETTGLDHDSDEIIELAMQAFTFDPESGRIYLAGNTFRGLRQPTKPISPEITALTGLDDAAVAGQAIDPDAVAAFIDNAVLIVAHNAGFDRPFAQRFCPAFAKKCWACSQTEIDWRAEGFESSKLAWLLSEYGMFYDRHRASADCLAVIELLAQTLPKRGVPALAALLEGARKPTFRIWAVGSPFEAKDTLKARGYRWNDGADGRPKSWFFDARDREARETELAYLGAEIFRRPDIELPVDKITAFERFAA